MKPMLYRFWLTLDEWWFRVRYALARSDAERSRLVMARAQKHMAAGSESRGRRYR